MEKEDLIVDSAIGQMKKHPNSWFSIDELCASLSISKRTFYQYFETKNKLVERIIYRLVNKWRTESARTIQSAGTVKEAFLDVYTYHLNEIISFNSDFLNYLKLKFPGEYDVMEQYFAEARRQLLNILEDGRKRKEVKEGYNLEIFIEKEIAFFEYLQKKHHVFTVKEDYLRLLTLSLDGLITKG